MPLSRDLIHKLRVVAAGRGKSMSLAPMVDAVQSLLLQQTTRLPYKLVYLGTPSYDKLETFHAQAGAFQEHPHFTVHKLDLSEAVETYPTLSELQSILSNADVIMVSGGNTLYAMNRWKSLGVDQLIHQIVINKANPPVLCGGSAGAICWFDYGHSDSMDPTTFLRVDPNLTEEQKRLWKYIRYVYAYTESINGYLYQSSFLKLL
jgi:dipeptidase E